MFFPKYFCKSVFLVGLSFLLQPDLLVHRFTEILAAKVCLYSGSITTNRELDSNAESQCPVLQLLNQNLHLTRTPGESYKQ